MLAKSCCVNAEVSANMVNSDAWLREPATNFEAENRRMWRSVLGQFFEKVFVPAPVHGVIHGGEDAGTHSPPYRVATCLD